MLKRYISSMLIIILLILPNGAYARESLGLISDKELSKKISEETAIKNLEKFHVIYNAEDRWDNTSRISRRDMFKVAYVLRDMTRTYYLTPRGHSYETVISRLEDKNIVRRVPYVYADIKDNSDDFYFTANLYYVDLLSGREEDGELYADLDNFATYNDAFATISRIFSTRYAFMSILIPSYYARNFPNEENIYLRFCEDVGLVNSKNYAQDYSLEITPDRLNEEITAYEYLCIIDSLLYLQKRPKGEDPITNYRIIDTLYQNPDWLAVNEESDILD